MAGGCGANAPVTALRCAWLLVAVALAFSVTICPVAATAAGTAPASETCSIVASPGDAGVGIAVATDASCKLSGGVGCIGNSVCRYCKARSTPQSQHLNACTSGVAPASAAPLVTSVPSATPRPPTPTTVAPVYTSPQTPATDKCTLVVAAGDASVGISIATDAKCKVSGGVGCIGDTSVCRYCKTRSTPQSQHLIDCAEFAPPQTQTPITTTTAPVVTTTQPKVPPPMPTPAPPIGGTSSVATCDVQISVGDAAAGIAIMSDASCASGGLGCINELCRYCRVRDTPQSGGFLSCALILVLVPAPSVTPCPTPVASQALPATATPSPVIASQETCSLVVAKGDADVGIAVLTDASCRSIGGVGCVRASSVCRYCKTRSTAQSNHLLACSSFVGASPAPPPTAAAVPSAPTPAGGVIAYPPPADCCSRELVTNTIASAGIWSVFDPSCPRDADDTTNDCSNYCRMCKFAETSASTKYRTCSAVLAAVAAAAAPTSVQLMAPATPPASACSATLSQNLVNNGIWMKPTCVSASSTNACLKTRCDYCKYLETAASANYPPCDDPVSIDSSEVHVEQATIADRFKPLQPEHQLQDTEDTEDAEDAKDAKDEGTLSVLQYSVLIAAAVGVIAIFAVAAMGLTRTVRLQTEHLFPVQQ